MVQVPDIVKEYVVQGALPTDNELQAAAAVPQLHMKFAVKQLKEAAEAAATTFLPGAAEPAVNPAAVSLEAASPMPWSPAGLMAPVSSQQQ